MIDFLHAAPAPAPAPAVAPQAFLQAVAQARSSARAIGWPDLERLGLPPRFLRELQSCSPPEGTPELLEALIELLLDWDLDRQAPRGAASGGAWREQLIVVLQQALRPALWRRA